MHRIDPASSGGAVVHLGVDIGTSNTAAVLRRSDGTVRSVLFDGAPSMPSAVFAGPDGFVVGTDAHLAGLARPTHLEPHPKQRIDDGRVLLGDREVPVETLICSVLRRVVDAALPLSGGEPPADDQPAMADHTDATAVRRPTESRRRVVLVAAVSVLAFIASWTAFAVADLPVLGRSTVARALGSAPPAGDLVAFHGEVADCTLISRDPTVRGAFHGFRLNSISFRWQSRDSRYLDRVPVLRRTTDGSAPNTWQLSGLGAPPTAADSTTLVSGHPVPIEGGMPGRRVTFAYTLDPDNLIPETDETNNTVTVTVSVPPDADDTQPDRAVPCTHG